VPSGSTLAVFALASFLLIVVPGPAVLYVVTRSIAQGRRARLVSMLGIELPEVAAGGRSGKRLFAQGAVAMLSDGAYALVAGTAGDWLRGSERVRRWLSRFSGAVFVGLGVTAALSGRPHD
jgi:threonine/homoserine/homoserine lactone efflux protein